jgi:hypothetical protein
MTLSRTAFYGVGGALLVAYLAAANMPSAPDESGERPRVQSAAPTPDAIAEDVRAQAGRLQSRMRQAPVPETKSRNPFAFGETAGPRPASPAAAPTAAPEPLPAVPPPPALTLMGIAEENTPQGVRRTAIIGGTGDTLYIVGEGQPVGDRYRATKIGADAVELEDIVTKAYRRLALR